ncbi:MAG TPA: hypothetical protein VGE52_02955, partial [Pirellulales bacterium]
RAEESSALPESQADEAESCGAFGWLRGGRDRALMLELRKKNGNVTAVGYAWLHEAEFDPSKGIILAFGTRRVALMGRNLNAEVQSNVRLFQALLRHRVSFVQEATEATLMSAGEGEPVIERIDWL